MKIAMYGLLYGDYYDLHARLIKSLQAAIPADRLHNDISVTFWCNQVCQETKDLLESTMFTYILSDENIPKYRMMRTHLFRLVSPDAYDYDWIVWFDDDSWITKPDKWLNSMLSFIESKKHEEICYIGEPWFWDWRKGQWEFVEKSKWFKGKPPEMGKKPRITFAQGGLWWLRTDVLKKLDWPDERLEHNGGDTLLAEAVRQQGLPFHKVNGVVHGFKTNDAKRRGLNQKPAGQS